MNQVDCVLARAMAAGSLQQIVFRMDALQELHRHSVPIINSPKTIESSVDKYLSLSLIRRGGIDVPETGVFQNWEDALCFFSRHKDIVVKPIFGSEGRGLMRFKSSAEFESHFSQSEQESRQEDADGLGAVYYLQEFLPHDFDIRILVVGDELFGMKRVNGENWISNACQGAECFPYAIPEAEQNIAMRAAAAVEGQLIGVDLIHDHSGLPRVIEVNASPGWKAISSTLNVDIAERILRLAVSNK